MRDIDPSPPRKNVIDRRQFVVGSGMSLAALLTGNTPLPPIMLDAGGQQTQGGWLRGRVQADVRALALDDKPVPVSFDNRFLIAFDRDAGPAAQLAATLADGSTVTLPLSIAPRAWAIERVNVAKRPGGTPDAEFLRIRETELTRIKAARALDTGAQGWRQDFIRPAPGRFSGRFGSQRIYKGEPGSYHSGLDIAGGAGTTYVAPADGVVVLTAAAPFTLEGHLLILDHGGGLNSAFLHASQLLVREGAIVLQNEPLGTIGMTGRATGPHLHWAVMWRSNRLDPMLLLRNLVTDATR